MKSKFPPLHIPPSAYTPFLRRFTDERALDLADIKALYKKVTGRFNASMWAQPDIVERINGIIAEKVVELAPLPPLPVAEAMDRCQLAILALETTLFRPATVNDWSALSLKEQIDLRRYLRAQEHFLANEDRVFGKLSITLVNVFAGVATSLPKFSVERGEFTVPLYTCVDARDVVDRIIGTLSKPELADAGLFIALNDQIYRNLCAASNLVPYEEHKRAFITAADSKLPPEELIETYLGNTPFVQLFRTLVPFDLAQYKKHHWSIYARTGHGKTQLLQSLILGHLNEPNPPGLIVIDSESNLKEQDGMLSKIERLRHFDPELYPDRLVVVDPREAPALNLFDVASMGDEAETEVISLYNYIFQAIDADLTSRQGTAFNFLVRLMFRHKGATLLDLMRICDEGRDRTAKNPFRPEESHYWPTIQRLDPISQTYFKQRFFTGDTKQTREQLSARLFNLLSIRAFERMFSQPQNKLDLYRCMEDRKCVLISTSGLGDAGPVFGRIVLAMAVKAAYQRRIDNDSPALLFIDEASTMLDKNVEDMLIKTRKYGLFLRFATQHYAQLPDKIRAAANSNTTVKLTGGLSIQDARFFAGDMKTSAEFLASTRFKDKEFAEFACFIQNITPTAVMLEIPFGLMEAEERLAPAEYRALYERTRGALSGATTDRTAPITEHTATTSNAEPHAAPAAIPTPDEDQTWEP